MSQYQPAPNMSEEYSLSNTWILCHRIGLERLKTPSSWYSNRGTKSVCGWSVDQKQITS